MAKTLRISDPYMELLRTESRDQHRTLAGQAEYWMALGRAVERSRLVDFQQVRALLDGGLRFEDLDDREQEFAFDQFLDRMAQSHERMDRAMQELRHDAEAEADDNSGL